VSRRVALALALLLALGPSGARAGADVAPAAPLAAPAAESGGAAFSPVAMRWAILRVVGATVAVMLLMGAAVAGYQRLVQGGGRRRAGGRMARGWFARWVPEPPDEVDRIHVVSRSYVGPRESLGLVRVGDQRFLVGITGTSITLLSRLDAPAEPDAGEAPDFAATLADAFPLSAEQTIRTALLRSCDRLATATRGGGAGGGRG
jgi:flagellar biogenesis protein FliO